jgi:hypothetical protein
MDAAIAIADKLCCQRRDLLLEATIASDFSAQGIKHLRCV